MSLTSEPSVLKGSRMSPDEFRAEVKRRGWTYRALAIRWDVSETWVSRTARTPDRPQHWDDAVRGLPVLLNGKLKPPSKKQKT